RIGCNLLKISPPDTALLKPAKLFVSLRSALRLVQRGRTIRSGLKGVNTFPKKNPNQYAKSLIWQITCLLHLRSGVDTQMQSPAFGGALAYLVQGISDSALRKSSTGDGGKIPAACCTHMTSVRAQPASCMCSPR
ncbi:hypothetical protein, partial [Chitiniphilus shinanonensis]|uniref:hypothetical protein n=1 Tax=Chitiniphilus shinanonensis TaxID=553088 RepID=UPI0024E1586B